MAIILTVFTSKPKFDAILASKTGFNPFLTIPNVALSSPLKRKYVFTVTKFTVVAIGVTSLDFGAGVRFPAAKNTTTAPTNIKSNNIMKQYVPRFLVFPIL